MADLLLTSSVLGTSGFWSSMLRTWKSYLHPHPTPPKKANKMKINTSWTHQRVKVQRHPLPPSRRQVDPKRPAGHSQPRLGRHQDPHRAATRGWRAGLTPVSETKGSVGFYL